MKVQEFRYFGYRVIAKIPYGYSLTPIALLERFIRYRFAWVPSWFILNFLSFDKNARDFLFCLLKLKLAKEKLYAQNLQDAAALFFSSGKSKYFIDLGAAYPYKYSNSAFLQEKGWSGLLVEANPKFYPELELRTNDLVTLIRSAVGTIPGDARLLNAGPLSSLLGFENVDIYGQLRHDLDANEGPLTVKVIAVIDLFKEKEVEANFGYLSIDIEGVDLLIMQNIFENHFRPSFITIEHNYTKSSIEKIHELASEYDYEIICKSLSAQDYWLRSTK